MKYLFLFLLAFTGCCGPSDGPLDPEKPWRITHKSYYKDQCTYYFTDGIVENYFTDSCNQYKVGDTLNKPF